MVFLEKQQPRHEMYIWGRSDSLGYVPHGHIGSPRIHFAAGMPQALAGGPAGSRRRRDRHSPEEQQEHVGRAATARLSPAKAQGRPAAAPTGGRRTLGEAAADQISRGRAYRGTTGLPKREPKTPRSAAAGEASPSEKAWSKKTPVQENPGPRKPQSKRNPRTLRVRFTPSGGKWGHLVGLWELRFLHKKTSRLRTQSTCTWLQCPGGTIRDSANAPDAPHHALLWNDGEISPASPHRL